MDIAEITLPVTVHKSTIYTPLGGEEGHIDNIATVYGADERAEARAQKIALALNFHDKMIDLLKIIQEHAKPQTFGEAYAPMDSNWVHEIVGETLSEIEAGEKALS